MSTLLLMADAKIDVGSKGPGLGQLLALIGDSVQELNRHLPGEQLLRYRARTFTTGSLAEELDDPDVKACFLFGHSTEDAANEDDRLAFERFLHERSGRCFATGDHQKLGSYLSGQLSIVSQLRLWDGPGPLNRLVWDTRVRPSSAELDTHPKPIFPNWGWGDERRVHPLLDYKIGLPICFLPDHEHEGALGVIPEIEGWEIDDVAHAVVRQPKDQYAPRLVPIIRIAEHGNGARVIVDSTIHHWLNESWDALVGTEYIEHVRAYARNVMIQMLPDTALDTLEVAGKELALRNAKIREDPSSAGAYASAFIERQDPLLWRVLRESLKLSKQGRSYARLHTLKRFSLKMPGFELLNKDADESSFESDLAELLVAHLNTAK